MDCNRLLTAIFGCLLVTARATVDLSCQVQRTISQPVTDQPYCPDSNTHLCPNEVIRCSCFGEGVAIEWKNILFSNNLDFTNTGTTMVGARERDDNTGALAVVTAVNLRDNITTDLTLNVTTTAAVNASQFNNTAIRCQDTSGPPGGMEQTILIYAPPPAPTITGVRFTAGVSFTVEWSETPGSCETVDGFTFNITPNDLSCTRSSMTTVTCSYNRAHLGQTYTVTVAALNCDTQRGNEATRTVNLQVPNPPTLTVTPMYDSSGGLLEIDSQAIEGPSLNITDGVDSSPTQYIFSYNGSVIPLSLGSTPQCTSSSCQHTFRVSSSQAQQYTVSVAARNVVGVGTASTPVTVDSANRIFNVTVDTGSRSLVVTFQFLNGPVTSATCTVRYGTDPAYVYLPNTDSFNGTNVNRMTVVFSAPLQTETLYYCLVSSMGVQMQGTFRLDCVPEDLGNTVDTMLNSSCQSSQSPPSVGSVQIGNGTACYNGLLTGSEAVYSCINCGFRLQGVETRRCQRNGFWSGTTPVCQNDCSQIPPPPPSLLHGGQLARNACTVLEYVCPPVTFDAMSGTLRYNCSSQQWSATDLTSCSVVGAGVTVGMMVPIGIAIVILLLVLLIIAIILYCMERKGEASTLLQIFLVLTVLGIPCAIVIRYFDNNRLKKKTQTVVPDGNDETDGSSGNGSPGNGPSGNGSSAETDEDLRTAIIVLLVLTVVGIPFALILCCCINNHKTITKEPDNSQPLPNKMIKFPQSEGDKAPYNDAKV